MTAESDATLGSPRDRRDSPERRRRELHALAVGSMNPRRRAHRRGLDGRRMVLDFHEARWLGIAMLIMLMSVADAFLTLKLIELGAMEVNPLMRVLLDSGSDGFAYLKVALTASGVIVLSVLARVHAFGRLPVGVVLYGILGLYGSLIAYEFWLLRLLEGL
ncbi:MAG: DUF5658 family protein [Steroidobacteraceae bacterium]